MQISLMVEGQVGLTWARWRELVARVEDWGFAGLYRSDHFTPSSGPYEDSLETILSLGYLADHTKKALFGPLVSPLSFREPVMLARQAAHLDDLSGGRMVLGVGAGWQKREHEAFGYPLLDVKARMARFAEGLQVIHLLLKSDTPATFQGRWYTLSEAQILPRPYKTRILVGGNGMTRTLPLAARYADVWNGVQVTPERFRELSAHLDKLLYDASRQPTALKRTAATFLYFGRDHDALRKRIARFTVRPEYAGLALEESLAKLRASNGAVAGVADDVIPQIQAYADAGVAELMLQTLDSDDIAGFDWFAKSVLPHFR